MALFDLKIGNSFNLKIGRDAPINKQSFAVQSFGPASIVDGQFWQEYKSLTTSFFGVSNDNEIMEAITECPQVGAILFNKCNAYINGRMQVLQLANDNPVKGLKKDWQALVNRPNVLQSGAQFRAQVKFYIMAFGYCPVLRIMPEGYEPGSNITGLWVLPPHSTEIEFRKGLPFYETDIQNLIESIKVVKDNKKYPIIKEDVYIFTDTTPLRGDSYLPSSRISILKYPINNSVKGMKTEGRIISKPLGMFSNQAKDNISSMAIDALDKQALHDDFRKYGTGDGMEDVIITDAALQWQHMMYPVAQLQMIELRSANTAAICDGMGYPFDLIGKHNGSTFDNVEKADKLLYQNHIIPEAENIDQQWGECLFATLNKIRIVTTYDHVQVLQQDAVAKSSTRKTNAEAAVIEFDNNMITYNQFLSSCGYEEVNNGMGDKYKYQIPQFNTKQNGNNNQNQGANAGGDQGNSGGQGNSNQG